MQNFVNKIGEVLELAKEIRASMDRLAAALEKSPGATVVPADPSNPAAPTAKPARKPKAPAPSASTTTPSGTAPESAASTTVDTPKTGAGASTNPANDAATTTAPTSDTLDDMFNDTPTTPVAPVKEATQDEMRARLNVVIEKKGKEVARKIVIEVGNAQTFTLIPPAKYGLVVAACDEVLK